MLCVGFCSRGFAAPKSNTAVFHQAHRSYLRSKTLFVAKVQNLSQLQLLLDFFQQPRLLESGNWWLLLVVSNKVEGIIASKKLITGIGCTSVACQTRSDVVIVLVHVFLNRLHFVGQTSGDNRRINATPMFSKKAIFEAQRWQSILSTWPFLSLILHLAPNVTHL